MENQPQNEIDTKINSVIKELNGLILIDALTVLKEVEKEINCLSVVSFDTYQSHLLSRHTS